MGNIKIFLVNYSCVLLSLILHVTVFVRKRIDCENRENFKLSAEYASIFQYQNVILTTSKSIPRAYGLTPPPPPPHFAVHS